MTPKISFRLGIVGAVLAFAAPAFADSWGADRLETPARVSPEIADRAITAGQQRLFSTLDARERSLLEARDATIVSTDPVRDDRFRLDPSSLATATAAISSDDGVEWLQVGIGFGLGALLAIGLFAAMRMTGVRQPAH